LCTYFGILNVAKHLYKTRDKKRENSCSNTLKGLEEDKMRKLLSMMALFIISVLMVSMVSASVADSRANRWELQDNLEFGTIKINGDEVDAGREALSVEEGQTLNIRVGVEAFADVEDIEVEGRISGYEYSDYDSLNDAAHLDRMDADTTKYFNLEITLPRNLEKKVYWLRLRIMNRDSRAVEEFIELSVDPSRHAVDIADVSFSPGNTLKAGRSLLTTVLLQNYGYFTEKDVKVTVSIPALGVSATEFVDVVSTDNHNVEYEDVPEMFLPIPASAEEGDYNVVVSVRYDDLRETVTETQTIHVVGDARFQTSEETLVLAVGPSVQNAAAGKTATYAIALTNAGVTSKAYMLNAAAGSWATISVSESLIVLEPGRNKVVYVDVAVANDAAAGEQVSSVVVSSGDEVLETIPLRTNVVAGSSAPRTTSLRNGLEIALIVLVVLLVIIGLIIGFSRLRKDEEGEEQTYY
jgi:uncharacterized membrane protein